MRILFASTAGAGHLGPLLPFARAARRAGHEVLFVTPPGGAPHVARAGFALRPTPVPDPDRLAATYAALQELEGELKMVAAVNDLFGRMHAQAALPGIRDAIERWRPDLVVGESMELASPVAAEAHGVPFARVGICLSTELELAGGRLAIPALAELRASAGLQTDAEAGNPFTTAPYLTLAPRSASGPARTPDPPVLRRVRDPRRPLATAARRDTIYVSLGSEAPAHSRGYFPTLYREIVDRVAPLGAPVVVAVGHERDPRDLGPVPANVSVRRWVDQRALLPRVAATVTHGGSGSAIDALAAGVPMAVVPLFADQPMNARQIAAMGAGIALDEHDLSRLGDAVTALTSDPYYRTTAAAVADELLALPTADTAIAQLEAHATAEGGRTAARAA